jgi:drug/metabolite transporter (DMT)-like permease
VLSQSKTVFTAGLMYLLVGKRLRKRQVLAIVMLIGGALVVNMEELARASASAGKEKARLRFRCIGVRREGYFLLLSRGVRWGGARVVNMEELARVSALAGGLPFFPVCSLERKVFFSYVHGSAMGAGL